MLLHEFTLAEPGAFNASLYARFMQLSRTDRVRRTHYFAGRFENIYMDEADIPGISTLLSVVKQQAGQLLGITADSLKAGFWFNAMETGHLTALHHHDENDELLSAVYYIHVPENSGDLILHDEDRLIRIQPQAGKLVLFAPGVPHEVTVNQSPDLRLSVGMNIGPAVEQ